MLTCGHVRKLDFNCIIKILIDLLLLLFSHLVMSDSCNPVDCNLPGSSGGGISQARLLEWVAIFFSRGFSRPRDQNLSPGLQVDSLTLSHLGTPHV